MKRITPARGPISGGTEVTVLGRNLNIRTEVLFGGRRGKTERAYRFGQRLKVRTPPGLPITVPVQLASSPQASEVRFTYIDEKGPNKGEAAPDALRALMERRTSAVQALTGLTMGFGRVQFATICLGTPAASIVLIVARLAGQSNNLAALIAGLAFLVVTMCCVLAFRVLDQPWSAVSTQYTEIVVRLYKVNEKLKQAQDRDPAGADARAAIHSAKHSICDMVRCLSVRGPQWPSGNGYLDAWLKLHDSEECVALFGTRSAARAMASEDIYRLAGSQIEQATSLQAAAKAASDALTGGEVPWPGRRGSDEADARQEVRRVRSDVNSYRDERFRSLVDGRDALMTLNAMVWLTVALAVLGLLYIGQEAQLIASGALIFLVGAGTGLVSHLITMSQIDPATSTVQDFGLSIARGFTVPIISGAVAVLGVIVVAALHLTINGQSLAPAGEAVDWHRVFNAGNGGAVGVAILFGFAPDRFLSLLKNTNQTKIELSKSEPSSG